MKISFLKAKFDFIKLSGADKARKKLKPLSYNRFMKSAVILLFLIFSVACAANQAESQKTAAAPPPEIPNAQTKPPLVLVELFTSEG
jgi:hypothetical protein